MRTEKYYECRTVTEWWDDGCGGGDSTSTPEQRGPYYRPNSAPIENSVGTYQVCSGSTTEWMDAYPDVQCSASCYPAPVPTPLSGDTLSPQNVPGENGSFKLPVNVGWSDVEEITNTEEGGFCEIGSYRYRISGAGSSVLDKVVGAQKEVCGGSTGKACGGESGAFETARRNNDIRTMNRAHAIADRERRAGGSIAMDSCVTIPDGSECAEPLRSAFTNPTYDYLTGQYAYDFDADATFTQDVARGFSDESICALESGREYSLTVAACIDGAGEDCGAWSGESSPFSFQTGRSPQLKYPYDPDWEGPNSSNLSNTPIVRIPLEIAWCPVSEARDYHYIITKNAKEGKENVAWENRDTPTGYKDETGELLQKGNTYYWKVGACTASDESSCSFSQLWSMVPGDFDLAAPVPVSPESGGFIHKESSFSWNRGDPFASFFAVRIWQGGRIVAQYPVEHAITGSVPSLKAELVWDALDLASPYEWQAGSCTSPEPSSCESWSRRIPFTTAGTPPENLNTSPVQDGRTGIPSSLSWAHPWKGAASYQYEVLRGQARVAEGSIPAPPISVGFSEGIRQNEEYSWRVRSCAVSADRLPAQENECGAWAQGEFQTVLLKDPQIVSPEETAYIPSAVLEWDPVFGAGSYEYKVTYERPSEDEHERTCLRAQGTAIRSETTKNSSATVPLSCFGSYTASVRACTSPADASCTDPGPWGETSFEARPAAGGSGFGGLVPCGRSSNPKSTGWDEREPCQAKHLFLGLHTLFSFLLWRLIPLLILLFAIGTGAILYLSLGDANLISQVTSAWKALGVGALIVFSSWMILNILLGILGFNVTVFGVWYQAVI